jgi:hypothetical protein
MSQRANLIKCAGLITHGSELSRKEGALVKATNINVDEDGVITPRRGFNDYGNATDEVTSKPVKQLFEYKQRLFRHFEDQIQFEDENGLFQDIAGSYIELREGYRIKYQEAKSNMYFTTEEGIKRISIEKQADLSSTSTVTIEQAGVPKAAYMEGTASNTVGGFLPAQSKVAYRFLFGRKDNNNNLLLGSPSARHVISNIEDKTVTYQSSDLTINHSTTPIVDGDYIVISSLNSKHTFYFNVSGGTVNPPYTSDTFGTTFVEVDISSAASDNIKAAVLANSISSSISTYNVTLPGSSNIVSILSNEEGTPDPVIISGAVGSVVESNVVVGNLVEGQSANCDLTLIIPASITTDYFVQVYRTAIITAVEGQDIDDIDPGDECNIVYEKGLTQDDINAGEFTFTDTTPESFRGSGAALYTNEITGEGILQSNDPPPIALDMTLFRNSMFYANTKSAHRLEFDIISVDNFVNDDTRIIVGNSTITRYYTAAAELADTPEGGDFLLSTLPSVGQAIDETARSIVKVINQDSQSPVNAFYLTGADDLPGQLLFEARDLTDDTIYVGVQSGYQDHINGTVYGNKDFVHFNNLDYIHSNIGTFLNTPWDSGVTYQTGDIVSNSGQLWIAIDNDDPNLNKDPSTEVDFWQNYSATIFEYSDGSLVRFDGLIYKANSTNSDTDPSVSANWDEFNEDPTGTKTNNTLWSYINIGEEFSPELPVSLPISRLRGNTDNTIITLTGHGFTTGDQKFISFLNESTVYNNTDTYFVGNIVSFNDGYHECIDDNAGAGITGVDPTNLTNWQSITYLPDSFSGIYTVTVTGANTFTIDIPLLPSFDSSGANPFLVDNSAIFSPDFESDNLEVQNRIYFSKVSEPEAVPIANYIDVGAKDEEIKRIIALRDNLFVLKDDGIYIVSGTSAPNFSVRLLDNTRILAPDSAVVLNNQIYCLTEQGITVVTDSGAGVISRGIEDRIDSVINSRFDYVSNTFGIAYENDRAYLLFLPESDTDTSAVQAYRYNIFERTWSRWEYNATCGLVAERDTRLYLGEGGRSYVAQERKNFDRTDHADREFVIQISADGVNQDEITISNTDNVQAGDVITQTQEVSINYINNRLLSRMDIFDTGVSLGEAGGVITYPDSSTANFYTPYHHNLENNSTWTVTISTDEPNTFTEDYLITVVDNNNFTIEYDSSSFNITSAIFRDYYTRTFSVSQGDNMVEKFQAINDHLYGLDPVNITDKPITSNSLLDDVNTLIDELNVTEAITKLKDYKKPETVVYEAYIKSVDVVTNVIIIHAERPFLQGDITVYKHFTQIVEWSPQHFGDPSALKQVREVTMIFDQNNFYDAIAKFGSDVDQALTEVAFQGKGIGYWGDMVWSNPNAYWGGEGNDIPFRTIVPRGKQRCRYITLVFEHSNAREDFRLLGVTGVVRPISSRGYR